MTATLTDIFRIIKEIRESLDELPPIINYIRREKDVTINLSPVESKLDSIQTTLNTISTTASSIETDTSSIESDIDATLGSRASESNLNNVVTNTNATGGKTLAEWLQAMESDLNSIKSDTANLWDTFDDLLGVPTGLMSISIVGILTQVTAIQVDTDNIKDRLDDVKAYLRDFGYIPASGINHTITLVNATPSAQMVIDANHVLEFIACKLKTNTETANRDVDIFIVIDSEEYLLTTITAVAGTTYNWDNTIFDEFRDNIMNYATKLTSDVEFKCTAAAITADKTLVFSFGFIKVVDRG